MSSSGLAFWTIFRNNFRNGFLRILNSYKYKSEKTKKTFCISLLFCFTYLYLGNTIGILFIFDITIPYYLNLLGFFFKMFNHWLNGFRITRFFEIKKKLFYLSIYSLFSPRKLLESTKNINKITKEKSNTNKFLSISSIIIVLLFLINVTYFKKQYKINQQLSLLKEMEFYYKNPKNCPIVPQLLFRLNDNEIIIGVSLGCENESISQGRSYVDVIIDISNCYFSRYLSYSGNGGVIYVTVSSCSMNINYSMFYYCVCSSKGGAIYFSSSNSSLRMICANSCSCGGYNSYIFSYLVASQVNQVEYLSVSNCSHTTFGYYPIRLDYGNQRVDNTNSSLNNAAYFSGILIWYPSSFTSSHCTFSNNKVSDS